jgi:hypothetical protein
LPCGGSGIFPLSKNGSSNVDVVVAVANDDGGTTYSVHSGVVPESELFTFDPMSLKVLAPLPNGTARPCFTLHAGTGVVLWPSSGSGLELRLFDTASASVIYELMGASNLLHDDPNILMCAISQPRVTQGVTQYDFLWLDRSAAGSGETLQYAPLQCGPPP